MQYARYLTLLLAGAQSLGTAIFLEHLEPVGGLPLVYEAGWGFRAVCVLTMTTGTMFLIWLGDQITERGIGNGMALIIITGAVSEIPRVALITLDQIMSGAIEIFPVIALMIAMVVITGAVIFMVGGHRRVTVQYARRVLGVGMHGGTGTHIPLKVNASGVVPVIFASITLNFLATTAAAFPVAGWGEVIRYNLRYGVPLYYVLFLGLIIFFAYLYTALIFDPADVAENMPKYGGSVLGVKPGRRTAEYIDALLTRNTLLWSMCLGVVVILPDVMILGFRPGQAPAIGNWLVSDLPLGPFSIGGATLLVILVVVLIDMLQQLQSQVIIRPYQPDTVEQGDDDPILLENEPMWSTDVGYEKFVPVCTPRSAAIVSFVESLLQSAGIRFFIKNEQVQDLFGIGRVGTGFSIFIGAPAVFVEPTRADEAAELLASIEAEQLIGTVVHYFAKPQVGVVRLAADLEVGETLHFRGRGTDFQQVVKSMQSDHRPVRTASAGGDVAVEVDQRVRAGTQIYRVTPLTPRTTNIPFSSSPEVPHG
jgi:preprotein translocase subunit SecY